MKYSVNEIANFIDGKVIGSGDISISNIQKIEVAKKGDISFISNPKYLKYLKSTKASAVIIDDVNHETNNTTLIIVKDAYLALAKLIQKFENASGVLEEGWHATAAAGQVVRILWASAALVSVTSGN